MPARRIRFLTINSRWQGFYTKLASEANIKKGSRFLDMLRKSAIGDAPARGIWPDRPELVRQCLTHFTPGHILVPGGGRMPSPQPDQRTTRRFPLQLPVTVKFPPGGINAEAQTRDVSARGICFYLDSKLDAGSNIEFTLTLPAEVTMTQAVRIQCKGKVLRVENSAAAGKIAVAAQIEQYEFVPEK